MPPEGVEAFDSNCITPGTAFMARLGAHLRFHIRRKMKDDPEWQTPRIIFSGAPARAPVLAVPSSPLTPHPVMPRSLAPAWKMEAHDLVLSRGSRGAPLQPGQAGISSPV